jgi:hypothetical protein
MYRVRDGRRVEEAEGVSQWLWEAIGIAKQEADCLEAQGDDVVHENWFAEEISGSELGLMNGQSRRVNEDRVAQLGADVTRLAILQNIDDEPDFSVASMAWLS